MVLVAGAAIAYYVYRKTNQTAIYNDRYPMAYR
jgi:hypothetical protein